MKATGEFLRRYGLLSTAGVLLIGFIWSSWKIQTVYDVKAHTEIVLVETPANTDLAWTFPHRLDTLGSDPADTSLGRPAGGVASPPLSSIWLGYVDLWDLDRNREFEKFAGNLQILGGCHLRIERILKGRLRIFIESVEGQSVGEINTPEGQFVAELGNQVVLEYSPLPNEQATLILPIYGQIFVGEAIGMTQESTNPVLLSGELNLVSHSRFGERFFEIDSFALGLGDSLTIERSGGETGSTEGFLRIDHDPAMKVVFRTVAWRARIQRFGGRPFVISAGLRDTLANNPYINTATSSFMAMLLFFGGWQAAKKEETEPPTTEG